jgi:molecular chaperone Hsp33
VVSDLTEAYPATDVCVPFLINGGAFRGRLVRLRATVTEILRRHGDPAQVASLLAEAMAAAVALANGLKYDGVFTLQIQSDGPVHMLVTDATSDGGLRGCAKFDAGRLATEVAHPRPGGMAPHLLGAGHLAFTVDQGPDTERYQGIVDLSGDSLAAAIHHYFRQSEQLESALKIAVQAEPGGAWTAGALLLQRMPEPGGPALGKAAEALDDDWRTAVILLGSLKDAELLDASIGPLVVLHRLFGTVGARALGARSIRVQCRCSRSRSERILASFPVNEVKELSVDGEIRMTCEFCREVYTFSLSELDALAEHAARAATQDGP